MHIKKQTKIGIFDSGLGGLTVLKSLSRKFRNQHSYIYFGDTAHLPYGDKSKDSIIKYSKKIIDFFLKKKVEIIIIACNSASSVALKDLQSIYKEVTIIGMIEPSVEYIVNHTNLESISIIGTETTIKSNSYVKAFSSYNYNLYSLACPLFVPLVEEGWENSDIALKVAKKYLSKFNNKKLDGLLLACTHYPLLEDTLSRSLDELGHKNVSFIQSGDAIAKYLESKFSFMKQKSATIIKKYDEFYVSDKPKRFSDLASKFLGEQINNVDLIKL